MKVYFVSLGCDKNTVDSEMMLGILADAGHQITYDLDEAEAVVVNTCSFIADAKQESINTILEMAELKNNGQIKALVIAGCLGQRYREEVISEIPEVDGIVGIHSFDHIVEALDEAVKGNSYTRFDEVGEHPVAGYKRLLTTATHYAYLKIAEGCNKRCTYCIIPHLRGAYRSVPMETLLGEATELASRGVKELILVAQETTVYGVDLYGSKSLPELLSKLCLIEGIERIRLLYCYPEEITDELIETIKNEPKICNYIDMPIQHASDAVLKRMGRRTTEAEIKERIAYIREQIPDICLRTTLITGFPGETVRDHKIMKEFVRECRFDRLGVFTYSAEEGTEAAKLKSQIPEWVKRYRRNAVMRLQQGIVFEKNASMTGEILDVMIEGKLVEDDVYVSRSYKDAPDVDGYIFVDSKRELMSGDVIRVRITEARDYDLMAEEISEE